MTWIRKKKKYRRPRKLFDKLRIEEENELVKRYGLKNKKEIWKADAAIDRIRNQAKKLITAGPEEQEKLFSKLRKLGFKTEKIADVLDLEKEDWLKRRLQSILILKNMAKPREARQLITHKHVLIDGKIVNIPGYIVNVDEESKIKVFKKVRKQLKGEEKELLEKIKGKPAEKPAEEKK